MPLPRSFPYLANESSGARLPLRNLGGMPLYSFEGKSPTVHPTAFVAPTASVIGDVTVE
jgi:hypothetical protein